jgi:hypothetical protein
LERAGKAKIFPARFAIFEDISMSQQERAAPAFRQSRTDARAGDDACQPILGELMAVLKSHPRGLRRWSVMRALRENRKRLAHDIPLKFESDVERVFRRFCVEDTDGNPRAIANAPFYRPRETAGEVWALNPGCGEIPDADAAQPDASIFPPR